MKVGQIGPTWLVPEKTVIFFGVKPVVPSFILKMRKSHKKSAHVLLHVLAPFSTILARVVISGETLCWNNCQLIGMSLIGLARQVQKNRD